MANKAGAAATIIREFGFSSVAGISAKKNPKNRF